MIHACFKNACYLILNFIRSYYVLNVFPLPPLYCIIHLIASEAANLVRRIPACGAGPLGAQNYPVRIVGIKYYNRILKNAQNRHNLILLIIINPKFSDQNLMSNCSKTTWKWLKLAKPTFFLVFINVFSTAPFHQIFAVYICWI